MYLKKNLLFIVLVAFPLLVMAQASGGQIIRKKPYSLAWSGVYSLRGGMYGSYDSDCTLILKSQVATHILAKLKCIMVMKKESIVYQYLMQSLLR